MDDARFDALTRRLSAAGSRRAALRALAGALALLGGAGLEGAGAHNALARCNLIADPQKRRTCRTRARRHNRGHTTQPPPGGACVENGTPCTFGGEPCCAGLFCSCETNRCGPVGTAGTGNCCRASNECLQECHNGVCCNPAFPDTCKRA